MQAAYPEDGDPHPLSTLSRPPRLRPTMARYHGASKGRRDSVVGWSDGVGDAHGTREPARDFTALATNLDRPSLRLRVRVSTQSAGLDNELARGASPMRSRELALRARQLVEPKRRERLASALESLCEHAQRAPSTTSIVRLPRREITEAGGSLLALAQRLRDPRPIYAAGAAMISVLLHDGTGPAYTAGAGPELRRELRAAAAALDGAWSQRLSEDRPTWPD
jgi:hypothetical protein